MSHWCKTKNYLRSSWTPTLHTHTHNKDTTNVKSCQASRFCLSVQIIVYMIYTGFTFKYGECVGHLTCYYRVLHYTYSEITWINIFSSEDLKSQRSEHRSESAIRTQMHSPHVVVDLQVCVFLVVPGNRTSYLPEREGLSLGRRPWSWMTGSPRLDRDSLTDLPSLNTHAHTHMQERGSKDMHLSGFMVMGHCLYHIHFSLSAGWFPFWLADNKRKMFTLNYRSIIQ